MTKDKRRIELEKQIAAWMSDNKKVFNRMYDCGELGICSVTEGRWGWEIMWHEGLEPLPDEVREEIE